MECDDVEAAKIENRDEVKEKQPLINESGEDGVEEQQQEQQSSNQQMALASYWKGCEFLKASALCSSKLSLQQPNANMCRICHTTSSSRTNPLISPCRCSGTLKYVHKSCVVRWLEISSQKIVPVPKCELCGYDFRRGNLLELRSVHLPFIDRYSVTLNIVFVICMVIALLCWCLVFQFIAENASRKSRLTSTNGSYSWTRRVYYGNGDVFDDKKITTTIASPTSSTPLTTVMDWRIYSCVLMFLSSFAIGVATQYRADCTIFRFCFRIFVINYNWMIKNYDVNDDEEYRQRSQKYIQATIGV